MTKIAITLVLVSMLVGCATTGQKVKAQAQPLVRCMSACAAQCMLESAKELMTCPIPADER